MASKGSPLYSPLDVSRSEIRLLRVENDPGQSISCRLETVPLSKAPPYTALSYVWGDENLTETISLDGQDVPVTANLAAALRCVKGHWSSAFTDRDTATFRIWIDALCINQKDIGEKGQQVQLMGSLYSAAELVIAWLGKGTDQTVLGLESLEKLSATFCHLFNPADNVMDESVSISLIVDLFSTLQEFCCVDDPDQEAFYLRNKRFSSMKSLLDLPYWDRAWILQEAVLAQKMLLCCAGKSVDMAAAEQLYQILRKASSDKNHPRPSFLASDVWNGYFTGLQTWREFARIHHQKQMRLGCAKLPNVTVFRAVDLFFTSLLLKATNPKDHVYAFVGLNELDIIPDYANSTPTHVAYVDYARAWIGLLSRQQNLAELQKYRACHLLFLEAAGVGYMAYPNSLPTWVPNYPDIDNGKFLQPHQARANAGISEDLIRDVQIDGTRLIVHGVALQSIEEKYEFPCEDASDATLLFLKFIGVFCQKYPSYITGIPPLQAVMRVFMQDCLSMPVSQLFEHFVSYFSKAANTAYMKYDRVSSEWAPYHRATAELLGENEDQMYGWLADNFFTESELQKMGRGSIMLIIEHAVLSRQFSQTQGLQALQLSYAYRFFTTGDGYLGLCPKYSEPGDVVCVLAGNGLPIVLRKNGTHYLHVGTCFILGFMDGEAAELVRNGNLKMERFEIH
ncbi:hypothetical protein NQ176_g5384 [Zarea fungicola]|uniref:Uncharacterized protein n=1 Tax=Zarea fungicola TaxID=93591 RepID=A0ACC1N9K1_9HYPO|nr:hypothetical protein NQ176_g5384 [Lecanicillium fungicola]